MIDAAGAAHLSLYGGERETSPRIDELARESLVFERAYAQAPLTLLSTASFLTGLYPARALSGRKLAAPTLAELLRARGYATAAFSENPWVSPEFRFARGFDEFQRSKPGIPFRGVQDSGRTVELALAWVDAHKGSPFFLYVHFLPPHTPYAPPTPFQGMFRRPFESAASQSSPGLAIALGERAPTPAELKRLPELLHESATLPPGDVALLRAAYHENLAYADAEVGRLVDGLRSRGLLERSILLVSSDHGEAFGEHGKWIHGTGLHEEQIRVPLVVRVPATLGVEATRWPGVVELVDLVPTLLDLLGSPVSGLDGKSWLPAVRGEGGSDEVARAWLPSQGLAAVIRGDSKLIEGKRAQLFDLASDPGETRDLADVRASTVESLRRQLDWRERPRSEARLEVDARTRAELEALGYTLENESH